MSKQICNNPFIAIILLRLPVSDIFVKESGFKENVFVNFDDSD